MCKGDFSEDIRVNKYHKCLYLSACNSLDAYFSV